MIDRLHLVYVETQFRHFFWTRHVMRLCTLLEAGRTLQILCPNEDVFDQLIERRSYLLLMMVEDYDFVILHWQDQVHRLTPRFNLHLS
ncbi:MAG: hypothetical protein HC919_05510 [Oscillatoriales cyanobacterium SM2_2_1]|nr:hypothetical protein [Oscillatoriales cyanobacterium SM2_2_1]